MRWFMGVAAVDPAPATTLIVFSCFASCAAPRATAPSWASSMFSTRVFDLMFWSSPLVRSPGEWAPTLQIHLRHQTNGLRAPILADKDVGLDHCFIVVR